MRLHKALERFMVLLIGCSLPLALQAQTGSVTGRVFDHAENLVGVAATSSEGAITADQLEARPIMRPGEILETVPGTRPWLP